MVDRIRAVSPLAALPVPLLAVPAVICGAAYLALVVVDRNRGTLRADVTPTTLWLLAVATVGYGLAVLLTERAGRANRHGSGEPDASGSARSLRLLWAGPIVFRLLLVFTDPTLSDDVYRYLWDGHVLSNGVNPYSHAIAAAELDRLAIPIRDLANNPDLSSPYLPTLQLLFAGLSLIAPSEPVVIQVVMVAFDLAAAWLLWRLLPLAGLPASRVLLYLWHPLVIVESAHGAHFDGLLTFLVLAAALAAFRPAGSLPARADRRSWSPVLLALGTLTRPVPALLAPVLWWRWRWSERVVFAAVLVGLVVPFGFGVSGWGLVTSDGTGVFGSARVYSDQFRFNAVVATWIERLTPDPETYRLVTGALIVAVLAAVFVAARPADGAATRSADRQEAGTVEVRRLLRLMSVPLAAYVVLTPVLHPWYLVLPIALGAFLTPAGEEWPGRWWSVAPLGYLAATVPLSYLTYLDPDDFRELDSVRRIQWWPALVLSGVAAIMTVWHRRTTTLEGST